MNGLQTTRFGVRFLRAEVIAAFITSC